MALAKIYWRKKFYRYIQWLLYTGLCWLLAGCFTQFPDASTPVNVRIPLALTPTILPADTPIVSPAEAPLHTGSAYTPAALPAELRDELPVMSGICFESAFDAAGRVFVLRTAEEHTQLYNLSDQSGLCRQPIQRYPFDFTTGRILAGLWSKGSGCTARHEVVHYGRDDAAKTIVLTLRFVTEGDCPYELVRPFWVSFPEAGDYEITLTVN